MNKDKASRAARIEGDRIANSVIRRASGYVPKIRDYPAVVVGCGVNRRKEVAVDYSRSCINYVYDNLIESALSDLGRIGLDSGLCNNIIGNCAEPHAANLFIRKYGKKGVSINDFEFGEAIRPRTGQRIPYCANCLMTFPSLLK